MWINQGRTSRFLGWKLFEKYKFFLYFLLEMCYNYNMSAPVRRVQFGWVKLLTRQSLASSRYLALEPKP